MRLLHAGRPEEFAWEVVRPVLALGTLDGVHLGHQAILARTRELAAELHGTPAALTFARHPLEVVRPAEAPPVITPLPLRLLLLERLGIRAAVALEFSPEMAAMTAEAFFAEILVRRLRVAGLSVGYDFSFGRGRAGTVGLLRELAAAAGVRLAVAEPVRVDGQVVSSRHIRALLAEGDVAAARRFLGRPMAFLGEVGAGAGRGRGLGFATANLALPGRPVLRDGVYAGRAVVRGQLRNAVMNLGVVPTFGAGARRLEVHLADWEEPLHGERLLVFVLARLRDERRFESAAALGAQVAADRAAAEAIWAAAAALPWAEWTLQE